MASSRFPGKPLVDIAGVPLVVRSARRARDAGCFDRVVVATEDPEIATVAGSHGFESLLTPTFPTGTDRVAWAVRKLGAAWAVNLQGDEPLFPLDLLRSLARALPTDPDALWTAADLALAESDRRDEDVVKIVLSAGSDGDPSSHPGEDATRPRRPIPPQVPEAADTGVLAIRRPDPLAERRALDFHRLLPPETAGEPAVHVGVYAGSAAAFARFAGLPPSDLEQSRRIEPLRALHAGMPVRALVGKWNRVAVDRVEHISMVLHGLKQQGE